MQEPSPRQRFFELLGEARELYLQGGSEVRKGLIRALEAVFASLKDEVRSEEERESIIPLIVLSNALSDLDDGIPSHLFEVRRKAGRRKDGFGVRMLKASSAAMVDCLHEQGNSFDDSAGLTARWLTEAGARTSAGHRISAETVLGWREQIQRMSASKDAYKRELAEVYRDLKRTFSGQELAERGRLRAEFVHHVKLYAPDLIRRPKHSE